MGSALFGLLIFLFSAAERFLSCTMSPLVLRVFCSCPRGVHTKICVHAHQREERERIGGVGIVPLLLMEVGCTVLSTVLTTESADS